MTGARWYDMDGNELHDMRTIDALLRDIDARRVMLTEFGERARVSTVLLVLDHGWTPGSPPLIFETMIFMDGWEDVSCYRTSTRAAALAAHDQACADVREMLARFDAEIDAMEAPAATHPTGGTMSRLNEGLFTSERGDWATPQSFFDLVDAEFEFTLDAAASPENAKAPRFYTQADDGLAQEWTGTVWCNPPYGRGIDAWVRKGFEEAQQGATVVMLIPARTDTGYWHDYVMQAAEVRLIRGRLVFGIGEARANAPFPSALVVFRAGVHEPKFSTITRGVLTRRAVERPVAQASLFDEAAP